jgi:predicted outer membrane protein
MSKLILTSLCAVAALGLAACGGNKEENMAVENMEDLNAATEDTANMDMNMDMNMDVNATDNAAGTETNAGNEATNNSY